MMLWLLLGLAGVGAQNPISVGAGQYCTSWAPGFTVPTGYYNFMYSSGVEASGYLINANTYGTCLYTVHYTELYCPNMDKVCATEAYAICPWVRGSSCSEVSYYNFAQTGYSSQPIPECSDGMELYIVTCVSGCKVQPSPCTGLPAYAYFTGPAAVITNGSTCPWACNSGFYQSGSSCVSNASLLVQGGCSSEVSCFLTTGGPSITTITCAGNAMVDYGTTFNGFCLSLNGPLNYIITASPYSNTIGAVVILNISIADGDVEEASFEYIITSNNNNLDNAQQSGFYFEMEQYLSTYTTNNCPYLQEIPYATGCSSVTIDGTEYDNLFMTFKIPGNAFYQIIGVPSNNYGIIITDPNTWFNISYSWQVACVQCLAGQYPMGCQGGNVGTCTSCPMGTYSNFAGATVCSPCPNGTYFNHTGATACASCQLCSPGYYNQAVCGGSSPGNCTKCTN